MAKLSVTQIMEFARDRVLENPQGLRHSEIFRMVKEAHPETADGTLSTQLTLLPEKFRSQISRPSRGLYVPIDPSTDEPVEPPSPPTPRGFQEEDFYEAFARFLKDDLEEVMTTRAFGGAALQGKWGTPDVIGVYKPLRRHKIKFDTEIVTAEVKIDPSQSVVAFGQAIAYRLFSTKVYLVMPNSMSKPDLDRLNALAMLFGLGLVTFSLDPTQPQFSVRVRAQRFAPDMFHVNEFADRLERYDSTAFEALFG